MHKILSVLNKKQKKFFYLFFFLSFFSLGFEILGLGLIIPFLEVMINSSRTDTYLSFINNYIEHDFKKNDLIIKKGTIFRSSHILALKTLGIKHVNVKKIPNILFFSTGNEISNHEKIPYWKVRNSNSHYIQSIDKNFLFNFNYGGILKDKDELVLEKKNQ